MKEGTEETQSELKKELKQMDHKYQYIEKQKEIKIQKTNEDIGK